MKLKRPLSLEAVAIIEASKARCEAHKAAAAALREVCRKFEDIGRDARTLSADILKNTGSAE